MSSSLSNSINKPFFVHKFLINGKRIMCDVNTCCVCEIDEVTSEIIDVFSNNISDSDIEKLYQKHGKGPQETFPIH